MDIRKYSAEDFTNLIKLLQTEGDEWICYWGDDATEKYKKALLNSITYVAYEDGALCGYLRSIDDCGFYIYICDLLVDKRYRGRKTGQKLMEQVCLDYPDRTVYVMSDVDEFYKKKGYRREGSIFEVRVSGGEKQEFIGCFIAGSITS